MALPESILGGQVRFGLEFCICSQNFCTRVISFQQNKVFIPFPMEIIDWGVLTYFKNRRNYFLPLRRSLFSWSMIRYTPIKDEEKKDWEAIEALESFGLGPEEECGRV